MSGASSASGATSVSAMGEGSGATVSATGEEGRGVRFEGVLDVGVGTSGMTSGVMRDLILAIDLVLLNSGDLGCFCVKRSFKL